MQGQLQSAWEMLHLGNEPLIIVIFLLPYRLNVISQSLSNPLWTDGALDWEMYEKRSARTRGWHNFYKRNSIVIKKASYRYFTTKRKGDRFHLWQTRLLELWLSSFCSNLGFSARRGFLGSQPINGKENQKNPNLKRFVQEQNKSTGKRIRERREFCFAAVPENPSKVFYKKSLRVGQRY